MTPLLKLYSLLSKSEKKNAILLLFLILIGVVLETFSIGLIFPLVNTLLQPDDFYKNEIIEVFNLQGLDNTDLILILFLMLVAVYFIKGIFLAFLAWRQHLFVFGLKKNLSIKLFKKYIEQPYIFHVNKNSSEFVRNIMFEVNHLSSSAMDLLILISELCVVLSISVLLIYLEPTGAFVVILFVGIAGAVFYQLVKAYILDWGQKRQYHDLYRLKHLNQGLHGIKDVKVLRREDSFIGEFSKHNTESVRVARNASFLSSLPRLWLEFVVVLGLFLLVFFMSITGVGVNQIVAKLALFAAAAFRLLPSFNRILSTLQALRYSVPVINVIHREFMLPEKPKNISSVSPLNKSIKLKNLSYKYGIHEKEVLKGINLEILKGQKVGFIGTTGSGKSTAVDIILGLLQPSEGSVSVDEFSIGKGSDNWTRQIGYVPQDIYLTDDTLEKNIAFGVEEKNIDRKKINNVIKKAELNALVQSSELGLHINVGEEGSALSGGEKQRIGIARALYNDPAIIILDEATSSLDVKTEKKIMETIFKLKEKTIVIIAHRLSTVENCDSIYQFEKGKILKKSVKKVSNPT